MSITETLKVGSVSMSETPLPDRPRRILRSTVAVVVGLLAVFILSLGSDVVLHATGIYPPWFQPMSGTLFLVATAYRIVYGVLGSYIAARLAPVRPMQHALVLGVLGLALSIAGAAATWNAGLGPRWYPLALVATALPCAWLGGKLRVTQVARACRRLTGRSVDTTDIKEERMNGHFYFEIQADDTQRAAGLYKGVFGWKFEQASGLPVEYWRIETGGARGGLLKRPAQPPPPQCGTNAFVVSIEVENFDETAQKILSHGGKIALPKFAVPGTCWQGYFIDTEGNTFGLFQVDATAK